MLLAHFMAGQAEERADASEADFQNTLFAVNPRLWERLYGQDAKDQVEKEVEWITPGSADFGDVLKDLEQMGYISGG